MKRTLVLLLSLLLLCSCAGCGSAAPDPDTARAPEPESPASAGNGAQEPPDITCVAPEYWQMKIVWVYDDSLLAVNTADDGAPGLSRISVRDGGIYREGEQGTLGFDALRPGMLIQVPDIGPVDLIFPAQFEVGALGILDDGDDLVGLYLQVLRDLWEVDPGLNGGITLLGLDFANAGLSPWEQQALEYLTGQELGLPYVTGTRRELADQGYIDMERLYWEDGLFFSLELTGEMESRQFTFRGEKWRSGLGAIYYGACKAEKGADGLWNYTVVEMAIS